MITKIFTRSYQPPYDLCEDGSQNVETFPNLEDEPYITSKWRDQNLNEEILLPRGDKRARG